MKDVTVTHKRFRRRGLGGSPAIEINRCVVSYCYGGIFDPHNERGFREFSISEARYGDFKRLAQVVAAMLRAGATDDEVDAFLSTQAV